MNLEDMVIPRRRALQIIGTAPFLLSIVGCPDDASTGQGTDEQTTSFPQALQLVDSIKGKIRRRLEHDLSPFTSGSEVDEFYKMEIASEVRELEGFYGELPEDGKEEFLQFMREQRWFVFEGHHSQRYALVFENMEWNSTSRYSLSIPIEFVTPSEPKLLEVYAIAYWRYYHRERLSEEQVLEVVRSLQTTGNTHIHGWGEHYLYVDHGKNEAGNTIYSLWRFAPPGRHSLAGDVIRHTVASRSILRYARFKEGFTTLHGREPGIEDIDNLEFLAGDGNVSGTEVIRRYRQNPEGCTNIHEFIEPRFVAVEMGSYWRIGLGDGRQSERNSR